MLESLTKGELRIVDLVARGWTNQEVADHLSLRTKTVEWTLTNVYRKLHLRSRTELALKLAALEVAKAGDFPGRHARSSLGDPIYRRSPPTERAPR